MTEQKTSSLERALQELDRIAPGAPLLALGQTVFWDEPMKAGIALAARRLGYGRRFVAGVHDTDYFAKLPTGPRQPGKYKALPHNDSTTRGLWSAAGEFSAIFGSETVVTREALASAGLRMELLLRARPDFLQEATEAYGWRGIVSLDDYVPVTAEVPLAGLFPELRATLDWALDTTLECLGGENRKDAERRADELRSLICDSGEEPGLTVGEFYRRLLPPFYEFCANVPVKLHATATTELLRFTTQTHDLPRFEILEPFVDPRTRAAACAAYDEAIRGGSGQYALARFGSGAIPFDLVIPGRGRGTIRLGSRGIVVMTREPSFITLKRPVESLQDLAEAIEGKFGERCTLVGKAVSLIGMLAREFVFVFHEGASSYVKHSRRFHGLLSQVTGRELPINPILRVRYDTWGALRVCCSWLRLPEPLQRPFGTEELCAPSLAERWEEVGEEQEALLERLGGMRRPLALIRFLQAELGGAWHRVAEEYEGLHDRLETLRQDLEALRSEIAEAYAEREALKRARVAAERAMGEQFRARIFEREPSADDLAERERLSGELRVVQARAQEAKARMRSLRRRQQELVRDEEVRRVHERRRAIEVEAELKRLRLIRQAVIASRGMCHAGQRPSAWWFRLVCPDGLWYRETVDSAECYLETLR